MKAAVLFGKKDIRLVDAEDPFPGKNEALIAVKAVGICGSDVHYYEHFGMGESYRLTSPQILGHEPSGVIAAVGSDVKNLSIGQRVTVEPGETCGVCSQCKSGHYNLCGEVRFLSTPNNKGAFAEYLVMNAEMLYPIPDDMSYETACLAEPLSVGIQACKQINARPGKSLLIIGAGSIGILALIAAKSFGVVNCIVCDTVQSKLDMVKALGASHIVHAKNQNLTDEINRITDGKGVDCCIEASGSASGIQNVLRSVRRGGNVALVGIPRESEVPVNVFDIIDKEIHLSGVFRYTNTYPTAIEILHKNMEDIKRIITGRFQLNETGTALQAALDQRNSLKSVILI